MMLDRRLQKLGTLLGLLAIWLTVLAPAISQVLVSRTSIEQSSYVECGARQGAPHYAHHARHAGAGGSHRHDTFEHGQACGYCGFFAHLPLLPGLAPRVVPARPPMSHRRPCLGTRSAFIRRNRAPLPPFPES